MDLTIAYKVACAERDLTQIEAKYRDAKRKYERAHADLVAELEKYGYSATEAVVKRAKAAGEESDARDQHYHVASGFSSQQWAFQFTKDFNHCDADTCYYALHPTRKSDETGLWINIFSDEKLCDVCYHHRHGDADVPALSELVSADIDTVDDSPLEFEWRMVGPKVKCYHCDELATYHLRNTNRFACNKCLTLIKL